MIRWIVVLIESTDYSRKRDQYAYSEVIIVRCNILSAQYEVLEKIVERLWLARILIKILISNFYCDPVFL